MRKKICFSIGAALSLIIMLASIIATELSLVSNPVTGFTSLWGWDRESYKGTVEYYRISAGSEKEAFAKSKELAIEIQTEGTVLLKNEGQALPLKAGERHVTVFGSGSVNISYGGTGSGEGNGGAKNAGLYDALEQEGFTVNPTMKKFYSDKKKNGYVRGRGTDMNGGYLGSKGRRDYGYSVNEVEREAYLPVRGSYAGYSDAAVVVFSRSAGEGQDLPDSMAEFYEADDKHYLELTDEECGLLLEAADGGFKKIIVLLNTHNAFETGFLFEDKFGIDSCLWIGGTGNFGTIAVAKILTGSMEPSGRLPDTYASDLRSAPAMQNYGDNRYSEGGRLTSAAYVAYAESIYIGYKYYETRYEDVVMGRTGTGDFDYASEVVFPFGFGLSYASFEWSDFTCADDGDKIAVSLTVTNMGACSGKDAVGIYIQKPYTEADAAAGIEKSAVELVAYAKTPVIAGGASVSISAEFAISAFASYDAKMAKTYAADQGTYLITAAKDAHSAVNNILSKKGYTAAGGMTESGSAAMTGTYEFTEKTLFDISPTGYKITNRFETESFSSYPDELEFLSRKDWTGSFPKFFGDKGRAGKAVKEFEPAIKAEMLNKELGAHLGQNDNSKDYYYNKKTGMTEEIIISKPVTSSGRGINFIDMVEADGSVADFDSPKWQELVECMSRDELYRLCSSGMIQISEVSSINKKRSSTSDSPMGLISGTLFPGYPVQAATWNTELASRLGDAVGEEALWNDVREWYAPACNTHRTPFGGRNYEYYSEDGTLAGHYAASVVKSAQARGLVVQIKHFALNDQDTNRGDRGNYRNEDPYNGLCTYANEQTIREIYLKPFQYAVEKGGAHGVMTSYNRIGNTWAGGYYGLVTEVLRNEWGMEGNAISDYAGTFGYVYMDMDQGLRAGNDLWLHPSDSFPISDKKSDAAIYYLQKAAKNILFAEAHSSRVNGLRKTDGSAVKVFMELFAWQKIVLAVNLIPAALLIYINSKNIEGVMRGKDRRLAGKQA